MTTQAQSVLDTSHTLVRSPAGPPQAGPASGTSTPHDTPTLTHTGLATVLLGAAMPLVDYFIVNVALPTIDQTLNASAATLELVVAGYGIAYALLLVVGGRLGDAFGRRRLFTIGLTAFTLTSVACGLAPTAGTLVLARIAQGGSAALMLPQVLSTVQATTTGEHRSRALGLFGATAGISTVIGQLLGGVLVTLDIAGSSWRPIFLVNLPIGIAGLVLVRRTVPETRSPNPLGVDRAGTVLFGMGLLALLVPLMEGRAVGWPAWTWVSLAAVPFLAAGFVAVERRGERLGRVPLLPPSVVNMPSMRRGLTLAVPFFSAFGGFMFVYALTLQGGLGLGPLTSGLALMPMALSFFVASLVSSRLVARHGRRVVTGGAWLNAAGITVMVVCTFLTWPDATPVGLAPGMAVAGFGQGLMMTTLFRVVLSQVPHERAGIGSGALATTQQTALAIGVAVFGSLFVSLSAPGSLGMRDAFALMLVVQALVALVIAVFGRRLPDPRS